MVQWKANFVQESPGSSGVPSPAHLVNFDYAKPSADPVSYDFAFYLLFHFHFVLFTHTHIQIETHASLCNDEWLSAWS